jgi:hypothetical protein
MDVTVWRLEFLQPDGRWTGPYCAEHMTERAFEIREHLIAEHLPDDATRPWPDSKLFIDNPGRDRFVCGANSLPALTRWFGQWFLPLLREGGQIAAYDIPMDAIGHRDGYQTIYRQRMAVLRARVNIPRERLGLVERIHPTKDQPHQDQRR